MKLRMNDFFAYAISCLCVVTLAYWGFVRVDWPGVCRGLDKQSIGHEATNVQVSYSHAAESVLYRLLRYDWTSDNFLDAAGDLLTLPECEAQWALKRMYDKYYDYSSIDLPQAMNMQAKLYRIADAGTLRGWSQRPCDDDTVPERREKGSPSPSIAPLSFSYGSSGNGGSVSGADIGKRDERNQM